MAPKKAVRVWVPNSEDAKRIRKQAKIAAKNERLCSSGNKQRIPSNIHPKSRPLAIPMLPVVRRSVIG